MRERVKLVNAVLDIGEQHVGCLMEGGDARVGMHGERCWRAIALAADGSVGVVASDVVVRCHDNSLGVWWVY